MTIKKWMKVNGHTPVTFAARLPRAPHWVTISRWMNGRNGVSGAWAEIITAVYPDFPLTNGRK